MDNIESDNEKKVKWIRIKRFSSRSIIIAAVLSVFFIFISIKGILDFKALEANTEQLIACENVAKDIRSASDLLTNDVRLFVMTSDRKYTDSCFEEANITRSQEKAIEKFESMFPDNIFIADLNKAVSESEKLMKTEYYSMRLICDVGGFDKTTLDAEIINLSISKEDNSLANDEKIVKAQNLVSNRNYEESKNTIIYNLDICLDGIVSYTENRQNYYIMVFKDVFIKLEIGLFILIVILLTSSFIVRKLIVKPLLTYNESIEKDQVFPVIGVVELQTLAENYNKVYEDNQETQRLIRHEAEHDALTGLLNRGSFNKVLPIYLNGEVPFSLILLDIDTFKPYVSTIINLTPDHLDYMASLDEYYASKMRIYENCESDDEVFVNNIDDETLQEYLQRYHVYCCVLTQSLNKPADCSIIDQAIYFRGEHIIDLKDIKIVGDHNVQNIMIATTICLVAGVSPRVIKDVVSHFKGVEHRIEFVREYNGVRVYNDSKATNTDASIIALKAFKQPVILLMGGFDKGLDLQEMSTYNSCIKKLVTFGAAGKRFKEDMHHQDAYYEETLKDAVNKAFEISEPGDIILLSPSTSSFDEFKGYEERGRIFKQYVNEK